MEATEEDAGIEDRARETPQQTSERVLRESASANFASILTNFRTLDEKAYHLLAKYVPKRTMTDEARRMLWLWCLEYKDTTEGINKLLTFFLPESLMVLVPREDALTEYVEHTLLLSFEEFLTILVGMNTSPANEALRAICKHMHAIPSRVVMNALYLDNEEALKIFAAECDEVPPVDIIVMRELDIYTEKAPAPTDAFALAKKLIMHEA